MPNQVKVKDLLEEGKRRIVFLIICVVGLSYILSVTSSSVWVNLPTAAFLVIILRYISLDFEMKRKAAAYNNKPCTTSAQSSKKPLECPKVVANSEWRAKVNSPIVEDAIDHFTRHLVSEWVTDLWYSRLTPDREGPEELVQIIIGVLGEISGRMRQLNLVDLLIRDLINLVCSHLELFRAALANIEKQHSSSLTTECRDTELKLVLAAENKLHPALFSAEAELKVLQHLMDGLVSVTFKSEDLRCSFFRYTARELLACAVMRPLLNLASPRNAQSSAKDNANDSISKDPLLSIDAQSSRSWKSLPSNSQINDDIGIQQYHSGGQWGDSLDHMSQRRTQALAPEHFENVWTKGRNYKKKDRENQLNDHKKVISRPNKETNSKCNPSKGCNTNLGCSSRFTMENTPFCADRSRSTCPSVTSFQDDEHDHMHLQMVDSGSSTSYTSEDGETSSVTGLDSPVTKVWDGRNNRNRAVSYIHHPLENFDCHSTEKINKKQSRYKRLPRTQFDSKRSRPTGHNVHIWLEVNRTSFLSGDGQDLLSPLKSHVNSEDCCDDADINNLGRIHSGAAASSSASSTPKSESCSLAVNPLKSSLAVDSFYKLKCEVVGANIVKSGSRTFAVYSISVTDVNNNSWSIKRRFRHFEELHRHLKEFPEYDLHLPPKHFLSTGFDVPIIQERCKLLDIYLKVGNLSPLIMLIAPQKLMLLPKISGSIEVWDFLSVDSQTYLFLSSFSIIKTLSVNLEDKPSEKSTSSSNFSVCDPFASRRENNSVESKETVLRTRNNGVADRMRPKVNGMPLSSPNALGKESRKWVSPNLSVPILDLVDVIFQLQDGGWIRRKAFWVAKQILQLGMGDALDDWLIEKIQLLRKGSVIASGVRRVEQPPPPSTSPSRSSPHSQQSKDVSSPRIDDKQQQEADRCAKFVYDLIIDHAPAAIVGLVGRKEYKHCARDLYFLLQSSVCMKQLAFDILEVLLLSAFPELDYVFKQLHEEKHKFGELRKT
ncbi:Sorting nexin-16 [Senna tora]|uniref:Sorting nexin-16 n=1 Tax=Senna tora TaxID=362788 RepID=A0A834W013_9FABA|nr:Sorting nexin-16 [Senna tora]